MMYAAGAATLVGAYLLGVAVGRLGKSSTHMYVLGYRHGKESASRP